MVNGKRVDGRMARKSHDNLHYATYSFFDITFSTFSSRIIIEINQMDLYLQEKVKGFNFIFEVEIMKMPNELERLAISIFY
jgi:hypothetical protein